MEAKLKFLFVWLLSPFFSLSQEADSALVLKHLNEIIATPEARNYQNMESLNQVADYIRGHFERYADSVTNQTYQAGKETYQNVIASFGTANESRIIIGAHYDVCGNQDGADDNASGVVGLLELARLLEGKTLTKRIDLVAYTLEEPPFFRSANMGSFRHAEWLYESGIQVDGMICLEMIGYFDEDKNSQDYPLGPLKVIYGSKGDYITVVRKTRGGKFARKFKKAMMRPDRIKTKSFQSPAGITGIDFSDHLNYWKFGYSAVMITNTGFFRNKNYHKTTDQIGTLDIGKMTAVIQTVFEAVLMLSAEESDKS